MIKEFVNKWIKPRYYPNDVENAQKDLKMLIRKTIKKAFKLKEEEVGGTGLRRDDPKYTTEEILEIIFKKE